MTAVIEFFGEAPDALAPTVAEPRRESPDLEPAPERRPADVSALTRVRAAMANAHRCALRTQAALQQLGLSRAGLGPAGAPADPGHRGPDQDPVSDAMAVLDVRVNTVEPTDIAIELREEGARP